MKEKVIRASALVLLLIICFSITSCKKSETNVKMLYGYFDTSTTVYDYSGGKEEDFSENCKEIEELLDYYHRLFDIYNEYSGMTNLATVNKSAAHEAVKVDRELIDFLKFSKEMYYTTDGAVNIAMGAVLSVWHDYREKAYKDPKSAKLPPMELLVEKSRHCDIEKLVIDEENLTVRFLDPEMSLDVGAIAKGYSVERAAELIKSEKLSAYVLDVGGNLRVIGEKPNGDSWRTGVKNPDPTSDEPYAYYLDIKDTSVVTSGDYQRYYIVDGKKYHHIINGETLMPSEHFASVTIVCEDSGVADALSTALFNVSYEDGVRLAEKIGDVSVVWVMPDGTVKTYGME